MRKLLPLVFISSLFFGNAAMADSFWVAGSFNLANPSKSGVKKGDILEFVSLKRTSANTELSAIGGLCDFSQAIVDTQTQAYDYIYCSYAGHVRTIQQHKSK